jgi:hypothetical protein
MEKLLCFISSMQALALNAGKETLLQCCGSGKFVLDPNFLVCRFLH